MFARRLKGTITENHEIKLDTPLDDLPVGQEIEIEVRLVRKESTPPLTPEKEAALDAEIRALMKQRPTPKTGAEIVEWLERENIREDFDGLSGEEWVERSRRTLDEESEWSIPD